MKVTTIAIDLAKNVFQVLGMTEQGVSAFNRRFNRKILYEFMLKQPPCKVVFEAYYSAHYWGELFKLGHQVQLIPAQHVTPYVMGNKNDKNDAIAIYEASRRPRMRFFPVKSEEQQEILMLHKIRERLIKQRTACTNQLRGRLTDFGITFPQGYSAFERAVWEIIGMKTSGL